MSIALFPELEQDAHGEAPRVSAPVPSVSALLAAKPSRAISDQGPAWLARPLDPDVVRALRRDLAALPAGAHVAFGSVGDPYAAPEHHDDSIPGLLRALARTESLRISVVTRSTRLVRDTALLARVAERHALAVHVIVATPDARLAKFLEPTAREPRKRLEAIARLRRASVEAGLVVAPLVAGVSDLDADLDRLVRSAAQAGARWVAAEVGLPPPTARDSLLAALRRAYPRVAARYEWWLQTNSRPPPEVRADAIRRLRGLAARHGVPAHPDLSMPHPTRPERQRSFEFSEAG